MHYVKLLMLSFIMAGSVHASAAIETALPLPTAMPLKASINVTNDGHTNNVMNKIALACGLLAFAAAAQQAVFTRKRAEARARTVND